MDASVAAPTPPRAVRYVGVVGGVGALAVGGSAVLLAFTDRPSATELALAGAMVLASYLLQRQGFVFHWRGQRTTSTLDEPAVLLSLLLLPPALAVLAVAAGIAAAQVVAKRKPLKAAYNIAAYGTATAFAAAVYAGTLAVGQPVFVAGLVAVFAYAILSNVLIAELFARLEDAPWSRIYRERFFRATYLNASLGYALVIALYALWQMHPLALLAFAPILFLVMSFIDLNAKSEREVRVRRQLEQMTTQLVASDRVDAIADEILDRCGELFLAGQATLVLERKHGEPPREWARTFEGGPATTRPAIEAPLIGRDGRRFGALRVAPAQRAPTTHALDLDKPLLTVVAGQVAAALEIVDAFHELVHLKNEHEGIVRNVPAGILRVDHTGAPIQWNDCFAREVGEPRSTWDALRAAPPLHERIPALLAGERFIDVELQVEGRHFTVSGEPLPRADGGAPGAVLLFHDLTPMKQAEAAMRTQVLTRPLVRRIVLDLVGGLGASQAAIWGVGRRLAKEVNASSVEDYVAAFRSMGLGDLHVRERNGETYVFEADDLLERRGRASQPTCHLARGFVEGVVGTVHGPDALGSEVKCQSQGHAKCVFIVKPRAAEPEPSPKAKAKRATAPAPSHAPEPMSR